MMPTLAKRMRPLLGTFVEIGAFMHDQKEGILNQIFNKIECIHNQMSFHNPNSALSNLNKSPGKWIDLPNETLSVMRKAKQLSLDSDHLFNCTLGGYLVKKNILPNHFVHSFQPSGKASDIEIRNHQARLTAPVLISLDGIAKGYAVDLAIDVMKQHNIVAGWVNAGGDMKVFGDLTLPVSQRQKHTSLQPLVQLNNQALASSEVHSQSNARFPGQILDNTGQQPNPGVISVMAKDSWLADGLTKVLALQPESERHTTAKRFNAIYLASSTSINRTAL
uniref:FAD:protein FMN transferase n=1 Tax=Hydrogenovibrio crunogenus (strain DSM 25203 / XCL-2) TaxID=317025 RepID=Q31IL1_HYDCU